MSRHVDADAITPRGAKIIREFPKVEVPETDVREEEKDA